MVCLAIGMSPAHMAQAIALSMENYPAFPATEELGRLRALYEQARQQQRDHDYAGAAVSMEQLVGADWPFDTDVLSFKLGLARSYQRAQMGDKAEQLLVDLEGSTTAKHPLYPEIYFQLSSAMLEGGDRTRGLERFRYLADSFAESDAGQQALLILAREIRNDGDIALAWMHYDRYLSTYLGRKSRHPVLLEVADMYFSTNELVKGEQVGLQVWSEINRYPDAGNTGLELARTFKRHGLIPSALRVANDLCGSDRQQAQEGCFLVAQLNEEAGLTELAIASYRAVLEHYRLSRLSVRAFVALGKLEGDTTTLPSVPGALLSDRENEHWAAFMTEIAKLAAKKEQHRVVIGLLEKVANTDDRISQQRARLFLNACMALAESEETHVCSWLDRAVRVRPYIGEHGKTVRTWIKECAYEYSDTHLAVFEDLSATESKLAVEVLQAMVAGWGTAPENLRAAIMRMWDSELQPGDRLAIAPLVIELGLTQQWTRWKDDLEKTEFALWDELRERSFHQTSFVAVLGLLVDRSREDEAVTWLMTFVEHAKAPGVERTRNLLDWLYGKKDVERYDGLLAWYVRWYPDSKDIAQYAAKQVELRINGPDLKAAWGIVEQWLPKLARDDARRFLELVGKHFMARGSPYIEPINAYLLSMAENEAETIDAHRQLGDYYLKMMDFDKAVIHLEQAFALSIHLPDKEKVKIGAGLLKAALEAGYEESYVRYLLAGIERIMLDVTDPAIRAQAGNQLGKLLQDLGLHEEAYRMLRQTADLGTDSMSSKAALYNLAKSYAENGHDDLAISTYMEYLGKYDSDTDPRLYNIALANALSIAMKGADPALIGELQMKTEALVNGVEDPFILLDLAQYFGRQGHAEIQAELLKKGMVEAMKQIEGAEKVEDRNKALELAVKRLFKMELYEESVALGEQYYELALANDSATQSERLHFAQYEMLRAKMGTGYGKGDEAAQQAEKLLVVAEANGYDDAAVKYLMIMANESLSLTDRNKAKEILVTKYPDSQPAFRAKVDLAAKAYVEGDKEKAKVLAVDALAQGSGEYQKNFAENIRYNVLYINAVLLDEEGRSDLSAPMWKEIDGYVFKDSWIYVDDIMKGESSGHYK
jgi:tetratricopeptide (TPR) repeat protein